MCLLLAHRLDTPSPVVWIAANRDERLSRPWEGPQLLRSAPPVLGGRDLDAGGSWLAANLEGCFVVGVTNARLGAPRGERSRGQLVLEVAAQSTLAEGVALLGEIDLSSYGPFNLLVVDRFSIWLATNTPNVGVERLAGTTVAVGNDVLDEPGGRALRVGKLAQRLLAESGEEPLAVLGKLLADHRGDDPICRHGAGFGTVCSTLIRIDGTGIGPYRFAPGPPCRTAFAEVTVPLPRLM